MGEGPCTWIGRAWAQFCRTFQPAVVLTRLKGSLNVQRKAQRSHPQENLLRNSRWADAPSRNVFSNDLTGPLGDADRIRMYGMRVRLQRAEALRRRNRRPNKTFFVYFPSHRLTEPWFPLMEICKQVAVSQEWMDCYLIAKIDCTLLWVSVHNNVHWKTLCLLLFYAVHKNCCWHSN